VTPLMVADIRWFKSPTEIEKEKKNDKEIIHKEKFTRFNKTYKKLVSFANSVKYIGV
jgi:hypothetical protein